MLPDLVSLERQPPAWDNQQGNPFLLSLAPREPKPTGEVRHFFTPGRAFRSILEMEYLNSRNKISHFEIGFAKVD